MAPPPAPGPRPPPAAFGPARFAALWQRCVASPPSPGAAVVYARLAAELGAAGRHYHNLGHIEDCVQRFDKVAHLLADPDAVELGLWFHDAILDFGASDNERRSAALFMELATGSSPSFRRRVARLVLATRHDREEHDDRAFIVDIDLAGLGAPWDEFMAKGELLRREFATVGDEPYYRAQVGFLQRLLARPAIFASAHFRASCEERARANLARLVALRVRQDYAAP